MTELTQIYLLLTAITIAIVSLIKTLKNIHNEKIRLYLFSRIVLYCYFSYTFTYSKIKLL